MKAALLSLVALFALGFPAHADVFDDQIELLRQGKKMSLTPEDFAEETSKASAAYEKKPDDPNAMADMYMAQVKWAILDKENHGGWPVRSWLMMQKEKRKTVFDILKARYDKSPEPFLAYCLIPPALYAKDADLGSKLVKLLKEKDPFLSKRLEDSRDFWVEWVTGALEAEK
ncbi:MAG: hypothetical protein QOE70_2160 [Chthoniobacter sp.]|jgi:hypothetical protein|nr:hypothetical protein [Chthoniobacter sp.]